MKINLIVIFWFICLGKDFVLTLNIKLTDLEENIIYSHLKNKTNLKLFYHKLIESNGIDNLKDIRQKLTNEDIQKGNIENKVNIYLKYIFFYFIF
jgi:hypothetical protein